MGGMDEQSAGTNNPELDRNAFSDFVCRQFLALVMDPAFPCLGARSAMHHDAYDFHLYPDLQDAASRQQLARDLERFGTIRHSMDGRFATFVASFEKPRSVEDETRWDDLIWRFLQALHDLDTAPWDPTVSDDPANPEFIFSFAGTGYFVVGLHPGASRHSRRFAYPTLVFNAHDQFAQLRHTGQFTGFQRTIRRRDVRLQGSVNPKDTVF